MLTDSSTTVQLPANTGPGYCPYKLPCGWCKELNQQCPQQFGNTYPGITWQTPEITCKEET